MSLLGDSVGYSMIDVTYFAKRAAYIFGGTYFTEAKGYDVGISTSTEAHWHTQADRQQNVGSLAAVQHRQPRKNSAKCSAPYRRNLFKLVLERLDDRLPSFFHVVVLQKVNDAHEVDLVSRHSLPPVIRRTGAPPAIVLLKH